VRAVDVRAVIYVKDMHEMGFVVDAVDDSVGATSRPMAAQQRTEERFPNTVWVDGECIVAELQNRGSDRFG
jgi:hypothetical protein